MKTLSVIVRVTGNMSGMAIGGESCETLDMSQAARKPMDHRASNGICDSESLMPDAFNRFPHRQRIALRT